MHALLLIAHGSRMAASNDEIRAMIERVRALSADHYALIDCAFLELAEPSIGDGIDRLIARGADHVAALPYFLAAGRHVAEDIPREIDDRAAAHPDVEIELLPYVGTADAMPRLIASMMPDDESRATA